MMATVIANVSVTRRAFVARGNEADGFYHCVRVSMGLSTFPTRASRPILA